MTPRLARKKGKSQHLDVKPLGGREVVDIEARFENMI
jgi:hypothetical protein